MANDDKKCVMVVDDNEVNIEILERRLSARGFDVVGISNSFAVMDSLREKRPDIVVLDLFMPDKDGYEVVSEIKAHDDFKAIPVIGYSSAVLNEDFERAREAGCDDLCAKDGDVWVLMKKIEVLLGITSKSA